MADTDALSRLHLAQKRMGLEDELAPAGVEPSGPDPESEDTRHVLPFVGPLGEEAAVECSGE